MHQGGQVSSREVGQLDCQLGVLQDAICQVLLLPQADVGVSFQHLGVLAYIRAAGELTTGADVLKVEEATMLVALMSKSKVNAGAVFGGGPHEVSHNAGDVEG